MISKSVQPILRFAHVGALRHGPLFCGNRPLGAPQRHGAFESLDGRAPQGKDKAPFGCEAGSSPGILQEELTCLYQGERIAENF